MNAMSRVFRREFAAYFATRRAIVGVLSGEAALIAIAWWVQ